MYDGSRKVLLLGGGVSDGCGFYRIHEPMRVAQSEGVNVVYDDGLDSDALLYPDGSVDIRSIDTKDADLVVFQRPTTAGVFESIRWLQNKGIACAVEMDDDLMSVHQKNSAYYSLNPKYSPVENWDWFKKSADIADLVICSTPTLLRKYAKHGRGVVVRNRIPKSYLDIPLKTFNNSDLKIGWTGTIGNHPDDLQVVGGHLAAVLQDRDFYVVGDGVGVKEALGISGSVVATGWVPLSEYITTMSGHIDIGVVPLTLSPFNQAKSYLKGLEMASQGIPSVVSNTDEYLYLSQEIGISTAKRGKDWQKHLKGLLNNSDRFDELRNKSRESVRPFTYENHVDSWVSAWGQAINNRNSVHRT